MGSAIIDGVGIVLDVAAAIVPLVPGGVSTGINSYRAGKAAVNTVKSSKTAKNVKNTIETASKNRKNSIAHGIPESQIGPSGKPKVHNVSKPNNKQAREAARYQKGANTKPIKHPSDKGQKTHYHSTRNGEKMHGGKNIHYVDRSTKKNKK